MSAATALRSGAVSPTLYVAYSWLDVAPQTAYNVELVQLPASLPGERLVRSGG